MCIEKKRKSSIQLKSIKKKKYIFILFKIISFLSLIGIECGLKLDLIGFGFGIVIGNVIGIGIKNLKLNWNLRIDF